MMTRLLSILSVLAVLSATQAFAPASPMSRQSTMPLNAAKTQAELARMKELQEVDGGTLAKAVVSTYTLDRIRK